MGFKSPSTLSGSTTFTLPDGDGTSGQVIQTNGSGTLSWSTPASGSTLTSSVETTSFNAAVSYIYFVDTSLGDVTATLPAASGNGGALIEFVITDSTNSLILDGNASETIDGATTITYSSTYSHIKIRCDGSNWFRLSSSSHPTVQKFTSGSGTYTTPSGVTWIEVEMVGGGGGGSGSALDSGTAGNGGSGGNTTFGTSLLNAGGGSGGTWQNTGG